MHTQHDTVCLFHFGLWHERAEDLGCEKEKHQKGAIGGTAYVLGNNITVGEKLTLYAQWRREPE